MTETAESCAAFPRASWIHALRIMASRLKNPAAKCAAGHVGSLGPSMPLVDVSTRLGLTNPLKMPRFSLRREIGLLFHNQLCFSLVLTSQRKAERDGIGVIRTIRDFDQQFLPRGVSLEDLVRGGFLAVRNNFAVNPRHSSAVNGRSAERTVLDGHFQGKERSTFVFAFPSPSELFQVSCALSH